MQSEREDTLEERYAIKFFLNLEKMSQKCMECFNAKSSLYMYLKYIRAVNKFPD